MPRTPSPMAVLDEEAGRVDALALDAAFRRPDELPLIVTMDSTRTDAGVMTFELVAAEGGTRRTRSPATEVWRTKSRKLSTAIRTFARKFPEAEFPPSRFGVSCRARGVGVDALQRRLRSAFGEALGQPVAAEAEPPPEAPAKPDPDDWAAVLRLGIEGARRWNRLRAGERRAVDLGGADLAGADLTGLNLIGGRAKGATLSRCSLRDARLGGACLDGADLADVVLEGADLSGASASKAVFRGARLAGASLKRGMFFSASFAGADLTGANLAEANLQSADFAGATLDGATLDGATFDTRTTWPEGFAIPADILFAGRGTDPRLVGKGKDAVAVDFSGLMARLQSIIDPSRMKRALTMLKKGRNQLFAEVEPTLVRGIVRSQSAEDLYYSSVLLEDGTYACCSPDLELCMGLGGGPCKHLLVLIIGLARAGQIDPATVDRWLVAASSKNHRWNKATKNHVSDTLLRFKGVQAGEVDWRPTETIPEDFYAF